MKYILAFGSTHKVLKAEALLREVDIPFRLEPAPKVVAPYCALVISLERDVVDRAREYLEGAGIEPRGIYRKEGGRYVEG